jgi:hypothetical protein
MPKPKTGRPKAETSRENGRLGGRPPGSEEQATIDKRANRAVIRELVKQHLAPIVAAQADNAKGVSYLVLRAPDGSFVRATDEKQLDAALASGEAAFRIYTKEPHHGSASMLLAYAADKPVEPMEVSGADGGPVIFKWQD